MKYPNPLGPGSTIGITGPSGGVKPSLHERLDLSIQNLESKGFRVKEGECLRNEMKHVSAPKKERAADFMNLYLDESVDAIFPPWGGDLLIEILPLLDFEKLRSAAPKWVIGYSDTSTLLLALTLKLDMATVHGTNLMDSIPNQTDKLSLGLFDALKVIEGGSLTQASAVNWQKDWSDFSKDPAKPFNLTERVVWKRLGGDQPAEFSGRLVGGCLDTIVCLTGTEYGDVARFAKEHEKEGTVLFIENCQLKPTGFIRFAYNLRLAGWLDKVSGIVIGRSTGPDTDDVDKLSYVEALDASFGDLEVPVIFDADIGHKPPQMTLINGAMATVKFNEGAGEVVQTYL